MSNELYHHGVKGMKWGVRRRQRANMRQYEKNVKKINKKFYADTKEYNDAYKALEKQHKERMFKNDELAYKKYKESVFKNDKEAYKKYMQGLDWRDTNSKYANAAEQAFSREVRENRLREIEQFDADYKKLQDKYRDFLRQKESEYDADIREAERLFYANKDMILNGNSKAVKKGKKALGR